MKVLIVDDDPVNVAVLEGMLADSGYTEVKSITDARLALETCKAFQPDLVLLDLIMPYVDGFSVLESIRATRTEKFLPVIVVTADVSKEAKRRALRAGASDFLLKPLDQMEVLLRMGVFMERRTVEEQLRCQKENAEAISAAKDQLVASLRQELQCQKLDADAAKEAKSRFLAMLNHELRTPLTPVLFWASGAVGEPHLDPEIRDGLKMICRNVELEVRLIEDLLDLSNISRGKLKLRLEQSDVHDLLQRVIHVVRLDAQDRNFEFRISLEATHRKLPVDRPRLQQVFRSLLRNAYKFTPGQGIISVRTYNPDASSLTIDISDKGIGIEARFLEKIFDAFEQVDPQREGLGLGLAIAKAIIEMHGGSIRAYSPGLGKGATFSVNLPVNGGACPNSRGEKPALEGKTAEQRGLAI
jgi:signal transduction histidine kinase